MHAQDRESLRLLRQRGQTGPWRTVKRWLAKMVKYEPSVMRAVARKPFGDLSQWIEGGDVNVSDACGCLVGTTALVLARKRNHFDVNSSAMLSRTALPTVPLTADDVPFVGEYVEAHDVVGELCVIGARRPTAEQIAARKEEAHEVGLRANDLRAALLTTDDGDGQKRAVGLIKREIRRLLKLRPTARRRA